MPFDQPNSYQHCGAKTRKGTPCKSPAMANGRCRMHGGSTPSGTASPHFQHGFYSQDAKAQAFWNAVNRHYRENLHNERQARFLEANLLPDSRDYKSDRAYWKALQSWKSRYLAAIRRRETDVVLVEDARGIYQAYCDEIGSDDFRDVWWFAVVGLRP